jgi:hypothetical protein
MSIAICTITINLSDLAAESAGELLIRVLSAKLLRIRSFQIIVPGGDSHSMPWSIDFGFKPSEKLPSMLTAEREAKGGRYTTLANRDQYPGCSALCSEVVAKTKLMRREASDYRQRNFTDEIMWKLWGESCVYSQSTSGLVEGNWYLREKLYYCEDREPLLTILCSMSTEPRPALLVHFNIFSHAWSFFDSRFDVSAKGFEKKCDLTTERRNAENVATALGEFVFTFPQATLEWLIEREHSPDLSGFIPEELQKRFGLPAQPKRVKDTPGFNQDAKDTDLTSR